MCSIKRKSGIGLLELMLALAIIGIMIMAAVRYYESTSNSQSISRTVDMINGIMSASQSYLSTHQGNSLPSIGTLISGGYLPQGFQSSGGSNATNPWGGNICLTAGVSDCSEPGGDFSSDNYYYVSIDGIISEALCNQLKSQLKETLMNQSTLAQGTPSGSATKNISDCQTDGSGTSYGLSVKVSL